MTDTTRVAVANGKYTVVHENGLNLHALRYGETWRDLTGDGLVLALVQEIEDLREAIKASLQSQDSEGWKEAAIAWEVCASLHREYCKGKDPFYKTRQADFVKHSEASREKALSPCSTEDKADAERYRWLRDSGGLHDLPYEDHGLGPEFPSGGALDEAIDHARCIES